MPISFDYIDSENHIKLLTSEVKSLIAVEHDAINVENVETFRSIAKDASEPTRSKILHMINCIMFNSQVNSVYGETS